MKVQITNTTDKKYIGYIFDDKENPITLDDKLIPVDKKIVTTEEIIFANSNYIIQTIKFKK